MNVEFGGLWAKYIRRTIQIMKFLIVEPSRLPNLIPLGSKYSPQDPVFKYAYPAFLETLLHNHIELATLLF